MPAHVQADDPQALQRIRINEIPTGKLRVIHVIMVAQRRFAVHGQVHVIGANLVSSEVAWEIWEVCHANPSPVLNPPMPLLLRSACRRGGGGNMAREGL